MKSQKVMVLIPGEEKKHGGEPQKIPALKTIKRRMLHFEIADIYDPNEFTTPS